MKKYLLLSMLAISTTLLFSCTNDSNDSSDSNESQKGQLKIIEKSRTVSTSGKVKDEDIIKYFYENDRLVLTKSENTINSLIPNSAGIGSKEEYFYDEKGKIIKIITSDHSIYDDSFREVYIEEYSYNDKGQINEKSRLTVASEKKSITNCFYDNLGRLIKTTNPDFIFGPQNFSYYDDTYNIKDKFGAQYDDKINMARFLSPTEAYADAYPYSANNVVFSEKIFTYDSKNRITKIVYPADYNNNYETTYEYID
jgi:hypothetical protein